MGRRFKNFSISDRCLMKEYSIREHRGSTFTVEVMGGRDVIAVPGFRSSFEERPGLPTTSSRSGNFAGSPPNHVTEQCQRENVSSGRSLRALRTLPGLLWRHPARRGGDPEWPPVSLAGLQTRRPVSMAGKNSPRVTKLNAAARTAFLFERSRMSVLGAAVTYQAQRRRQCEGR